MSNYDKGTKYLFAGNYTKALQFFKRERTQFKELYINMGNCYKYFNDLDTAEACYLKANDPKIPSANGVIVGDYTLALNNLGLLTYARGDDLGAAEYYKRALAINPVYYDALWNLGNTTLRRYFSMEVGDAALWKLGWELYEYRFKRANGSVKIDSFLPRWDGTGGKKVMVLTEQGFGDKIMFGRYLQELAKENTVYVQCHPSLDIFYSDYNIVRDPLDVPDAVEVPICSLAGHFGLVSGDWLAGKFAGRDFGSGLKIGCVWAGSKTHGNDRNRSCNVSYFNALKSYGRLFSLSPDYTSREMENIGSTNWSDTIANVLGMDLIVSVDTSIVHLAGSLGVPCIMVQPMYETDFRWGLGHMDTPWYESVVVVENPNSWDLAFKNVRKILDNV